MKKYVNKVIGWLSGNMVAIVITLALGASATMLVIIAWPIASDYVMKERRADARQTLMTYAEQLHECHEATGSYRDDQCPQFPTTSERGYYRINATALRDDSFTLTASPHSESPQLDDERCTNIRLDHDGRRYSEDIIGRTSLGCW